MIKRNYHWVVAAIISIEMIIFGGLLNAYSIFTIPISESFGVSRASYAMANIPYNALCFLSTLATNFIFRKTGYKKLAIGSLILCATALFFTSLCTSIWPYALCRFLFGVGSGACFTAGSVWIIKAWFHKHQGLLIGFVSMCTGLGGSMMTKLLSYIVTVSSWRVALQTTTLMLVPIILLFFLLRNDPRDMRLRPYGEYQHTNKKKKVMTEWAGFSLQELLHRPSFYLMCINTFLCVVALYMTSPIFVSYLVDSGYSKIDASSFHAVMYISLAVAKLAAGWFSDKFGSKPLAYIFIICTALAQFLLLGIDVSNPAKTYLAAILLGIGASSATVLIPLLTLPLFGYLGSTQINSIVISIPSLSNVISDTTANAIYDATGSYSTYFPVLIAVNVLLLLSYTVLFRFTKKDRRDFEQRNTAVNPAK